MRPIPGALQSFLLSRQPYYRADLYTITLVDGVTNSYWTDCVQSLTVGGNVYTALGARLERTRLSVKNTVEVPELVIKVGATDADTIGGVGFKQQMHNGYFDGATVSLSRVFMPTMGDTSLGSVLLFAGRMSQVKVTALGGEFTVKGANVLMNQYVPRNVYQVPCIHAFCDAGCTLAAATYTTSQTVGTGPTRYKLPWGTVPAKPNIYTSGVITMTSGAANGQQRTVKFADSSGLTLQYPLYNTPSAGDTFSAFQGCDKSYNSGSGQSCTDRSNTQHFRGFPFVPPGETAF
jgi:uncharacterized phage protein (TIGR02218 family)